MTTATPLKRSETQKHVACFPHNQDIALPLSVNYCICRHGFISDCSSSNSRLAPFTESMNRKILHALILEPRICCNTVIINQLSILFSSDVELRVMRWKSLIITETTRYEMAIVFRQFPYIS